jgi:hypothetical protein
MMEHVALGTRTMVAFVFAISAASKLHDRAAYAGFFAALRRTQLGTQPCDPCGRHFTRDRWGVRSVYRRGGSMVAIVAGFVAGLVAVHLDDLMDLFARSTAASNQ